MVRGPVSVRLGRAERYEKEECRRNHTDANLGGERILLKEEANTASNQMLPHFRYGVVYSLLSSAAQRRRGIGKCPDILHDLIDCVQLFFMLRYFSTV